MMKSDDLKPWINDTTLLDTYGGEAMLQLSKILCFNVDDHEDGRLFTGVVQADGVTVRLPYWCRRVSQITSGGMVLAFTFTPDTSDSTFDGIEPVRYGRFVTLNLQRSPGLIVDVTGDVGFDPIPDTILSLIASLVTALADHASGVDRIQSQSIDDVNYTFRDDSQETPTGLSAESHRATISTWSLCESQADTGGVLSFPHKLVSPPWWLSPSDVGRIGR